MFAESGVHWLVIVVTRCHENVKVSRELSELTVAASREYVLTGRRPRVDWQQGQDSLVTEKVFGPGWLGLRGPEKV